jgi:hypothetical protein
MIALHRACNLTSISPCLTGPVDYLFASRHKGPKFKSPGVYLCETGILLLALSRYSIAFTNHFLMIPTHCYTIPTNKISVSNSTFAYYKRIAETACLS